MKVKELKRELRAFSEEELRQRLEDLYKELYELNSQKKMGKVEKPHRFKEVKRNIARILTILNERKGRARRR